MSKNEVQVFKSDEFGEVRTVMRDGEPWFVAADVCRILNHTNVTVAMQMLDDDEVGKQSLGQVSDNGVIQNREMNIISEAGLYQLVIRSNLPEAKKFRRWVTHEVLPSIRKYGMYAASGIFTDPDTMAALIMALRNEQARGERLERRLNWLTSPSAQKVLEAERARKADDGDELPERAARLFVETINKMLEDGEARVRTLDESEESGDTEDMIGFIDDEYLYAIPQKTYETVARHCRAQGDSFPISRNMLNRCLRQLGIVEVDKTTGTATKPKWVDGRTKRFLWITREKMQ